MLECDIYYVKKSRLKGIRSACVHAKLLQSCQTLCDPTDSCPPGSSVHGILQAGILEWVVSPFSRGSSQPRDQFGVGSGSLPVFLPGESQGPGSLVGCHLWDCTESDTTEAT